MSRTVRSRAERSTTRPMRPAIAVDSLSFVRAARSVRAAYLRHVLRSREDLKIAVALEQFAATHRASGDRPLERLKRTRPGASWRDPRSLRHSHLRFLRTGSFSDACLMALPAAMAARSWSLSSCFGVSASFRSVHFSSRCSRVRHSSGSSSVETQVANLSYRGGRIIRATIARAGPQSRAVSRVREVPHARVTPVPKGSLRVVSGRYVQYGRRIMSVF